MALTKIGKEGITGISNSADATFLTATSSEGVTLAGTLAVTGVHTVGTNAVATSDGGAATTSIVQGLCKMWINWNMGGTAGIYDSFNLSSLADNATGNATLNINNDMANNDYSVVYSGNTYHFVGNNSNKAVGSCQVTIHDSSNNATDVSQNDAQVNGDLA